tara:strand:+ start:257 stop:505 length:249 start_codon:yes stop_codon:yes gene_type:complete
MHVFKHPKFYEEFRQRAKRCQKELRARNKSDQAISTSDSTECSDKRAPDQGQSAKLQAPSVKPQAQRASSDKRQAPSSKRQA